MKVYEDEKVVMLKLHDKVLERIDAAVKIADPIGEHRPSRVAWVRGVVLRALGCDVEGNSLGPTPP